MVRGEKNQLFSNRPKVSERAENPMYSEVFAHMSDNLEKLKDRRPLLSGNCRQRSIPVNKGHEDHMAFMGSLFLGWSYREIKKLFKKVSDSVQCDICTESFKRVVCYLKFHTSVYKCNRLCTYAVKNFLTPKGQEEYDELIFQLQRAFDLEDSNRSSEAEKIYDSHIFFSIKTRARELPSLTPFPLWDVEKENKIYLTMIDPPNDDICQNFRLKTVAFLKKFAPVRMPVPCEEQAYKLGSSKYYDSGAIRKDSEKPLYSYHGPFKYQRFMTGPMSKREVWLPSKAYKTNSSWWHYISEPILHKIDSVVANDALDDLFESVIERFRPCKTIDLKGFGLQYPREFIIIIMEELSNIYDSDEMRSQTDIAKNLFAHISIELEDGTFYEPKRGVGLGYYANLMTLGVAILLQETYVVKMFSDDILIDALDYDIGIEALTSSSLIINEEKSGIHWCASPVFAGVQVLTLDKAVQYYNTEQAITGALFTKRFHWERKMLSRNLELEQYPYIGYHYERIFGYEFFSGEAMLHPDNLGLNMIAPRIVGMLQDWELRRHATPHSYQDDFLTRNLPTVENYPLVESKAHHLLRRRLWRNRRVLDTSVLERTNPHIEEVRSEKVEIRDLARSIPMWAEMIGIYTRRISTGKAQRGLSGKECLRSIHECGMARDPIGAYATGGINISPPDFIPRPCYEEDQVLIAAIAESEYPEDRFAYRADMSVLEEELPSPEPEKSASPEVEEKLEASPEYIEPVYIDPGDIEDYQGESIEMDVLADAEDLWAENSPEVEEAELEADLDVFDQFLMEEMEDEFSD